MGCLEIPWFPCRTKQHQSVGSRKDQPGRFVGRPGLHPSHHRWFRWFLGEPIRGANFWGANFWELKDQLMSFSASKCAKVPMDCENSEKVTEDATIRPRIWTGSRCGQWEDLGILTRRRMSKHLKRTDLISPWTLAFLGSMEHLVTCLEASDSLFVCYWSSASSAHTWLTAVVQNTCWSFLKQDEHGFIPLPKFAQPIPTHSSSPPALWLQTWRGAEPSLFCLTSNMASSYM